jgi:hypothetical protein
MSGGGTQSKDELQEMFFKLNKITKEFTFLSWLLFSCQTGFKHELRCYDHN